MKSQEIELATEHLRPEFHFTPRVNWINDPNGMIYYKGLYHIYFQHNPKGNEWGNISWGHATSTDLINWSEQNVAILDDVDEFIFSGSTIVDFDNNSGLGTKANPPLLAFYTSTKKTDPKTQAQSIAYSLDDGYTWTKYAVNPIININSTEFRDPKVFKFDHRWILSVVLPLEHKVRFYSSINLLDWNLESEFGNQGAVTGIWECPDLFPVFVDGDQNKIYWVLIVSINPGGPFGGSATQYFLGDFDGKSFTPIHSTEFPLWLDYGKDNYAAVTISNLPNQRQVIIGWMSNWEYAQEVPTTPWRGTLTIPREIRIKETELGPQLYMKPVPELRSLRGEKLDGFHDPLLSPSFEAHLNFTPNKSGSSGIEFHFNDYKTVEIGYDAESSSIYVERFVTKTSEELKNFSGKHSAPISPILNELKITIYMDKSTIEVLVDQTSISISDLFFTDSFVDFKAKTFSFGAPFKINELEIFNLKSITK